jgi:hypothetical protein
VCDLSYKKSYQNDKIKGYDKRIFSYDNAKVMEEMMKNGPVVTEFKLFDDFLNYTSGIYQHKTGKLRGYYYVKITGWGIDTRTQVPFWKAAASFGSNWGKK